MSFAIFNSKKNMIRSVAVVLALGVSLAFQNCSDVRFENTQDIESKYVCDESGSCVLKGSVTVTAGVNLPPLKMFVVVDNSYTMKANQFNLAKNFNQMFDSTNSASLVPFDTTAYILNTTQYSYSFGSSDLSSLSSTLEPMTDLMSLSQSDFRSIHRPIGSGGVLSGAVPGDVIGYDLQLINNQWVYKPAPVLGYSSDGLSGFLTASIHKGANLIADKFANDFQSRINILNPDYNPDNSAERLASGQRYFPLAQDTESAMCATARVLRNPETLLKEGDQTIFLLVTDEDEADYSGQRCVQSAFKTDELVADVYCEERASVFTIKRPNCSAEYVTGYNVEYDYEDQVTKGIHLESGPNGIRYQPAESTTYLQTYLNYDEAGYLANKYDIQYKRKIFSSQQSSVKYCLAQIRDGVPIEQCSGVWKTHNGVNGDWSYGAACVSKAKELSGGNVIITSGADAPICQFNTAFVQLAKNVTCDTTLSTCKVEYPIATGSLAYTGFINTQTECNTQTTQLLKNAGITNVYDGLVDQTNTATYPTCSKTGTNHVIGACPNGQVCVNDPKTFTNVLVKGDYTDTTLECKDKIAKVNSYAILSTASCAKASDKTDTSLRSCSSFAPQDCKVNYSTNYTESSQTSCPTNDSVQNCTVLYGPVDILGKASCSGYAGCSLIISQERIVTKSNVSFVDGNLPGPQLGLGATCTSAMASEIAKIQSKFDVSTSKCVVNAINKSSGALNLSAGQTCGSASTNLCDGSSGQKRFCVANENSVLARTETIKEDLSCDSPCSDSKLNFCSRLPSAQPNTKIGEVLATLASVNSDYSCSVSISEIPVYGKKTVLNSEIENVCVAGASGVPRYIDIQKTSKPYYSELPIIDYVSGSKRNSDGSFLPEQNLRDYIIKRSDELFGKAFLPIVSTFVRQPADGSGTGGSIGTKYIELASLMNGQNTSVITGDYSTPLRELSQIIKDRVQRSFSVPQLNPGQEIRTIALYRNATKSWRVLDASEFIAIGKSVKIADSVDFDEGDKFQIEFW